MTFLNDNNTNISETQTTTHQTLPHWYSSQSGIHRSIHPSIPLPQTPYHDVVSHLFHHNDAVVFSSSPALIDAASGSATSYADLRRRVESLSAALQSLHRLAKGDVVLCLLPNCTDYPVVLLSVLRSGAVVSTMNPLSSAAEIGRQVRDCKPVMAFAAAERVEALRRLGLACFAVPTERDGGEGETDFDSMLKFCGSKPKMAAIKLDDTAAIMYSSGTTGASKGVVLTHRNLIAMIELFVRFEASQYEEHYSSDSCVYLAVLPMFHIYGLSLFVLGLLSLGVAVVVMRRFDAGEVVKAVERFRVTHFPVVPPVLTALTRVPPAERWRLRSLKQVSSGAAPLSGKAIEDFVEAFPHVDFIQGYGMTESTAVGTRGFNTKKLKNFCSIGLLAPNMEAKVVDWNSGTFLPPGGVGELWLRGPGIMKGYLNNEAATRSTIDEDGWLHTGDIVYFDQDGYLYIVDRLKEIIKYKGFQIAPADLEAVLASHPEILDAAVAGVPNEGSGEIPVAFVVRKNGSSISEEIIMDYVAKQVAPYKKIRRVIFTPSIPKSPAGKILRRELKRSLSSKL